MIIKKTIQQEIETTEDVKCDLCGSSCAYSMGPDHKNFNYASITASFGYGSILDDDWAHTEEKQICDKCYINLFPIKEEDSKEI